MGVGSIICVILLAVQSHTVFDVIVDDIVELFFGETVMIGKNFLYRINLLLR